MLFYVFSLQCISTFVVVRQETGHWKWVFFQWFMMTAISWGVCFAVWQTGYRLELG
ncbi:MAG: hypothetical protein PHV34_14155 [Verrucomicrobiae bacterium]|nr:hypothetical protein [Verrucomicrobiae bacterium]